MPKNSLIGTLPLKEVRAVKSLAGPHLDKDGKEFDPFSLNMMTLEEAVHAQHPADCFLTCYTCEGLEQWPRLAKQALTPFEDAGIHITSACLAFDWDVPAHTPWDAKTFEAFFELFDGLTDPHLKSWRWVYTSRHGARVIYTLPKSVPVQDAEQYTASLFCKFKEAGIHMDEACKDWTRLFRCPNVIRDGRNTQEDPFYFFNEQDTDLHMDGLRKMSTKAIPVLKQTELRRGQPNQEEVDILIYEAGSQNRLKKSAFYKDAKGVLKYSYCFNALFSEGTPLAGKGDRNNEIMKVSGTIIPMLLRKLPYLTMAHVYALMYYPVLQFDQDMDWLGHTWNAILSIWPVEIEKYNKTKTEEAGEIEEAVEEKDNLARGMAAWCNDPALQNDDERDEFIERHLLVNYGKFFYPILPDGGYSPHCLSKEQLIAHIRTTKHLRRLIPTQELGIAGKMSDIADRAIQNRYSVPVQQVVFVPQPGRSGYLEGDSDDGKTLKLSMYRRNPKLLPEYNELVDEWLINMFGTHYEWAMNWIANALAFEEGPICALSIAAPPGIGKKMLIEGLAECLENPIFATGKDVSGNFNGTMGKTPFLAVNEEWPKKHGESAQEQFKSFTAGDRHGVRDLYKPLVYVTNPMRLILTANNHDIIRTLLDKDMSPSDREAVGQRLLHFDLDGSAAAWLEERGCNALTAKPGERWIAGSPAPSNFLIAKHFLHLHATRIKGEFSGRFLVEGNCAKSSTFMTNQIVQKDTTAAVITAVTNLIEAKGSRKAYRIDDKTGALFITINAIIDELKLGDMPMPYGKVSQIVRNITISQNPVLFNYLEHHEIDCNALLIYATRAGRETAELRKIVKNQKKIN